MTARALFPTAGFAALLLLTACAAPPPAQAAPVIAASASPTPFQPGVYDSPFSGPLISSPAPTFTPAPAFAGGGDANLPPIQVATQVEGTAQVPSVINPLTGLPASDPALLERRPLAVKVANYPRYIRPQSGLTRADVVFEYYIEALLTRFIAIFYGNDVRQAGPVRSGRYFDEHIMRMYHAFYIFKYADPREYSYFKTGDLAEFLVVPGFGDCPPFFKGKRPIEDYNNVYFNTAKWMECAARKGVDNSQQRLRSWFYAPSLPSGVLPVQRIYTRYSVDDYNYWQFDAASGRYLRFQETDDLRNGKPEHYAPLMDDLTGQQVFADTVIAIYVSHTFANDNEQQDEVYHINLIDSGNAFVFRDGFAYPARWARTDLDQPLLITSGAGTPIYIKPGLTFFQVIGESSTVWSDDYRDWHFDFKTP